MRILSWTDVNSGALGRDPMQASATIGVFDGLHLGHQELIQRIVAKGPELVPTVFTFRDNPKRHTAVHKSSTALYSLTQKMEALEAKGVQTLVLIDFSSDFSKLLGEDFIAYLVRFCAVRSFVVGSDFKCGYRLSTDAHGLERIALKLGATAEVVTPLLYDGEPVSSSRIRHAIADGRMDLALAMLGRPYTLDLRGRMFYRTHGRVGLSMRDANVALPATGLYNAVADGNPAQILASHDGRLEWDDDGRALPRMISFPEPKLGYKE